MAKSIAEIKNEILKELKIGIDDTEGSFISSLVGAISTQIAMLEQAIDDVKVQQLPEFADMETLVLLGRKCGLYPMASSPSQISIRIDGFDPGYAVGDRIRFQDSAWTYIVQNHDAAKKTYTLECAETGAMSNAIPTRWYNSVRIEPRATGDREITARVTEVLRYGRDPEDISQFRLRVISAYNVVPVSANAHWVRTILTQSDLNIDCVRIDTPQVLFPMLGSVATVYVAGPNFDGVRQKKLDECRSLLAETAPIGMVFHVQSAVKLDHVDEPQGLSYSLQIATEHVAESWKNSALKIFEELIREYLRKLVIQTSPREKITIVPGELVGALRVDKTFGPLVVSASITYQKQEYTETPVTFAMNHIPWVTVNQIQLVDGSHVPVRTKLEYPEF